MKKEKLIRIFVDGSGSNGSGKGSGFAYLIDGESGGHVEFRDGLTNNQAEYSAILDALRAVPAKSEVEILSDSELAVNQLTGRYAIRDPQLRNLAAEVGRLCKAHKLTVRFTWIPSSENKADRLLSKKRRKEM